MLIQVGTDEILLDDAKQFTENARAAGVDVKLEIWDEMFHVFQLIPYVSEKITVGSIAEFVSHTLKDHHDDTDYQIMNSGTNIADEIISSYPEINQWVIAGYSVCWLRVAHVVESML